MATPDSARAIGAVLGGRYEILREIGRGGMATVLLARDIKHERDVAVKVLDGGLDEIGAERFLRETRIAAQLTHPHILPLHDSGEAGGSLYYVMPFVPGASLEHRLRQEGPLPVDEAVRIARDVALALAHAHERGVVHRDVKPANILLHEGEPMLADFGIAVAAAVAAGERLTAAGLAVGTPEYMSPEQVTSGSTLDGRSDVYSLGCVLFEMLTGEPPFTGPTPMSVLTKRLVDPPPSARRLRTTIPMGLDAMLRRALATSPADRFPTAAAFAAALAAPDSLEARAPVVAVLPFRTVGGAADSEFFADGITEDVIIHLSKVRRLDVIARSSSTRFRDRSLPPAEIAAALNATALLDGSVRLAGNRVRVVVELVDPRSGQQIWSETYDRAMTDIFAIQTDVALQIAAALQAELSPDERSRIGAEQTKDLRAYQLYVQGLQRVHRFTTTATAEGMALFEEALAIDPGYARVHAAIALVWAERGETGRKDPRDAYRLARESAARALALDPNDADAYCAMGLIKVAHDFDWTGGEAAYKHAIALQPGHAEAYDLYSRLCSAVGRYDESIELVRRAHQLAPDVHRSDLANALSRAGRDEEALEVARRIVERDPSWDRGLMALAWALIRTGKGAEGLAMIERAMLLAPDTVQWRAQYGQALGQLGRTDEARAIRDELRTLSTRAYVSPYHLAYVHTGLGEHELALDQVERAFAEQSGAVYGLKGSFLLAPLREHPRFKALLKRMNLG